MAGFDLKRPIAADPYRYFTKEEVDKSRSYQRPLQVARIVGSVIQLALLIVFVRSKAGQEVIELFDIDSWQLQLLAINFAYLLASDILSMPLDLWITFGHEQRWGFNTQTPKIWVSDKIKGIVLNNVLFGAVLLGIWWGIRSTDLWWLIDAVGVIVFVVILSAIAPSVIMPIFNKFTPLDREDLKADLARIAEKAGVNISEYKVMDASKRTTKDNAFFAGMGKTRRVVLFDNLLTQPSGCIGVVVAHEIGHWRRRHLAKGILVGTLSITAAFLAVKWASDSDVLLDWAGLASIREPAALGFFLLFFGASFILTRYVSAWFSRWFERQADLDALELTGDVDSYQQLWRNFTTRNLPDLDPAWWEKIKGSHPPIAERIAFAETWASANLASRERGGA